MIGDPLPLAGSHRVACVGTRKARLFFQARIGCETREVMTSAGPSRRIFRDVDNGNATEYTMPQVRRRQAIDQ